MTNQGPSTALYVNTYSYWPALSVPLSRMDKMLGDYASVNPTAQKIDPQATGRTQVLVQEIAKDVAAKQVSRTTHAKQGQPYSVIVHKSANDHFTFNKQDYPTDGTPFHGPFHMDVYGTVGSQRGRVFLEQPDRYSVVDRMLAATPLQPIWSEVTFVATSMQVGAMTAGLPTLSDVLAMFGLPANLHLSLVPMRNYRIDNHTTSRGDRTCLSLTSCYGLRSADYDGWGFTDHYSLEIGGPMVREGELDPLTQRDAESLAQKLKALKCKRF